jgi:hypothetical protein
LFACILIFGLCGGWWVDRERLKKTVDEQAAELEEWEVKLRNVTWPSHSNPPPSLDDVMRLLGVESGGRIQTRDWHGPDAERE